MKFACNYSKELIELLTSDDSLCDYIKIGDFGSTRPLMESANKLKPLLIHGFGWYERGGMKDLFIMDFDYMNKRLKRFETPALGMHAVAFKKDVEEVGGSILDHMVDIFKEIDGRLDCELIIENMDYSTYYSYETTVKETVFPEFYVELIKETGLNMLLDLSHALVSAYQLDIDIYDYLDRLPLESVREIHFSGSHQEDDKGFVDVHGILTELDYKLARYLAENDRIKNSHTLGMVTLEYGSIKGADKGAIIEQLNELKNIFSDI